MHPLLCWIRGVLSNIMYRAKKLTNWSLILCVWVTGESISVHRENSNRQGLIGSFKHTQTPAPVTIQCCKCTARFPLSRICFTAILMSFTGVWKYTPPTWSWNKLVPWQSLPVFLSDQGWMFQAGTKQCCLSYQSLRKISCIAKHPWCCDRGVAPRFPAEQFPLFVPSLQLTRSI